jgi:hypothetical protein
MVRTWLNSFPDPNIFYEDIEALITITGGPAGNTSRGIVVPNLNFLMGLAYIAATRGNEFGTSPSQIQCDPANPTGYGPINVETMMLMLGLISLSWLKVNIKKKTQNGHCRNRSHSQTGPAMCSIGSAFHKELYDDLASIVRQLVSKLEDCTPNVITVKDSDPVVKEINKENTTQRDSSLMVGKD